MSPITNSLTIILTMGLSTLRSVFIILGFMLILKGTFSKFSVLEIFILLTMLINT